MNPIAAFAILVAVVIFAVWGCNKIRNFDLSEAVFGAGRSGSAGSGYGGAGPVPEPASEPAASSEVRDQPQNLDDQLDEPSEEASIEQDGIAVAAFAAAATLADEVFADSGGYAAAGPDSLNEIAASRGESLSMTFTEAVSDSPSAVSVAAPATAGGSWGLAVWSPSGCHVMSKNPLQGTYRAQLAPDAAEWCTGEWARQDYDSRPWWGGDRSGAPLAVWTYQQPDTDPFEPFQPADEQELARMGDDLAAAVATVAAYLVDEMLELDGSYTKATPDALNQIGAERGWPVPMFFQAEESNSPLAVSVDAPTDADSSWGLAVWSPGGCLLVAKDPTHGTFEARLKPQAPSGCSGASARGDYDAARGEAGDRPDTPPLEWMRLDTDYTAPADEEPGDEESPDDDNSPADDTLNGDSESSPITDTPTDDDTGSPPDKDSSDDPPA